MNTTRKGNEGERVVQHDLESKGWTFGSRRHIGGAGDAIAIKPGHRPRLIEIKKTKVRGPAACPPADRQALEEYADKHDLDPEIAWVRGESVIYFPPESWPRREKK